MPLVEQFNREEEEGIDKYRRSRLWIVTSTSDINLSRSILPNRAIGMNNYRSEGIGAPHWRNVIVQQLNAEELLYHVFHTG